MHFSFSNLNADYSDAQNHRFIKWSICNGLGYKSFKSASVTLSGIETVQMIKKNQLTSWLNSVQFILVNSMIVKNDVMTF